MYNYFADIAACKLKNTQNSLELCESDLVKTMDNGPTVSSNVNRDQHQSWNITNPFLEVIKSTENGKESSEMNRFQEFFNDSNVAEKFDDNSTTSEQNQETDNKQNEKENVSQWAASWKEIVRHPQMNPPLNDPDAIDDYEILRESDTSDDDEYQVHFKSSQH